MADEAKARKNDPPPAEQLMNNVAHAIKDVKCVGVNLQNWLQHIEKLEVEVEYSHSTVKNWQKALSLANMRLTQELAKLNALAEEASSDELDVQKRAREVSEDISTDQEYPLTETNVALDLSRYSYGLFQRSTAKRSASLS